MKTSRLSLLVLAACSAAVIISCSDQSPAVVEPVRPAAPEASLIGSLLQQTGLLGCRPLPFDAASEVIGPRGGTIQVSGYTLKVPAGALQRDVLITAVAPRGSVNLVEFQPQGLQFSRPASLTMSYANCGLIGGLLPHHIAYTDNSLKILQLLPALDDLLRQTATASIGHFSGYAVAF
jgi:hypothetical protein